MIKTSLKHLSQGQNTAVAVAVEGGQVLELHTHPLFQLTSKHFLLPVSETSPALSQFSSPRDDVSLTHAMVHLTP